MGEGLGGASTCLLVATAGAIVSYIPIGALAAKIGRKRTIQCGIVLLATCFMLGYLLTTMYTSIQPIMYGGHQRELAADGRRDVPRQ